MTQKNKTNRTDEGKTGIAQKNSALNVNFIELFAVPIATGLVIEALRELLLGGWEVNKILIIVSATVVAGISFVWIFIKGRKEESSARSLKKLITSVAVIIFLAVIIITAVKTYDFLTILKNTITIDPAYHHLGDVELEFLEPSKPEGVEYSNTFFLQAVSPHSYLSITAKDVDQNLFEGGVLISINSVDFTYLNFQFQDVPTIQEHTIGERQVTFPIPDGILKAGMNTIKIYVVPDQFTGNVDDVQFRDLKIILK
jgi:uncharacterized MAPEG superfamily protein